MNLSQTAFVSKSWTKPVDNKNDCESNRFTIRWFSPSTSTIGNDQTLNEIKLCGHATFASASVLFDLIKSTSDRNNNKNIENKSKIIFETKFKGQLEAVMDWNSGHITISLPINEAFNVQKVDNQWIDGIVDNILGPRLSRDCVEEVLLSPLTYPLIRLKDCDQKLIKKISPNFDQLRKYDINGEKSFGVIVTERADFEKDKAHFFSRFFAPWVGVNEDPTCGSAHSVLAPYWKRCLGIDGLLIGEQCSQRGGIVRCLVDGDRVQLSGRARIVVKANISL